MKNKTKLPTFNYERVLWNKGIANIVGIDEVGRGSWAGPVVAGAVIFDKELITRFNDVGLGTIRDSKLLSPKHRKKLSKLIKDHAKAYAISEISVERINKWGIGKSSQYAFRKAVKQLSIKPDHFLVDAFYIRYINKRNQTPIIKGDMKSFTIAAASIIAKVYRDKLMVKLGSKYPKYSFAKHKGYGTKLHQQEVKENGLSAVHRTSFNIKALQ